MAILDGALKVRKDGGPVTIRVLIENGEKGYTGVELWSDVNGDKRIDPATDHRDVLKHTSAPPDDPVVLAPDDLVGKFLLYDWRTLRRYASTAGWRVEIIVEQGGASVEGCPETQTGKYPTDENVSDGWLAHWVEAK
jgi:hypothetical protein